MFFVAFDIIAAYVLQIAATALFWRSFPRRRWVDCVTAACAMIVLRRLLGDLMDLGVLDHEEWMAAHRALYLFISGGLAMGAWLRWRAGRQGESGP